MDAFLILPLPAAPAASIRGPTVWQGASSLAPRGRGADGRAVSTCAGGLVVVGAPVRRMAAHFPVARPGSGGALGFAPSPDPGG